MNRLLWVFCKWKKGEKRKYQALLQKGTIWPNNSKYQVDKFSDLKEKKTDSSKWKNITAWLFSPIRFAHCIWKSRIFKHDILKVIAFRVLVKRHFQQYFSCIIAFSLLGGRIRSWCFSTKHTYFRRE